jgi:hypothetical protein
MWLKIHLPFGRIFLLVKIKSLEEVKTFFASAAFPQQANYRSN